MKSRQLAAQTTRISFVFGVTICLLIACQITSRSTQEILTTAETTDLIATGGFHPDEEITPVVVAQENDTSQVVSQQLSPAIEDEPLRFALPATGQNPVSAWRPALFPIPWAPTQFDHFYFARPTAADEINWPLADYRYGGVFFENVIHSGVDIPTPIDTPVLAAGPGKVVWAGYGLYNGVYDETDPYGLAVYIRHEFGYQGYRLYTVYGHLDRVDVIKGQHVVTGEQIGLSGNTGKVTGPHLHFEVRLVKGESFTTRNPELWLVPPQGWGVLSGRVLNSGGGMLFGQRVVVTSRADGQIWYANAYGEGNVRSDEFYRENLVISDLPAGRYEVKINYFGKDHTMEIDIQPGLVSTFTFRGFSGFVNQPPSLPGSDIVLTLTP